METSCQECDLEYRNLSDVKCVVLDVLYRENEINQDKAVGSENCHVWIKIKLRTEDKSGMNCSFNKPIILINKKKNFEPV